MISEQPYSRPYNIADDSSFTAIATDQTTDQTMTITLREFEEGRGHFMLKPGLRSDSPRLVPVVEGEEFSRLLVDIDFDDIDTEYFYFFQESPWFRYLDEAVWCFFEGESEPEYSRWESLLLHDKFLGASKEMIHEINTQPISPGNFFELELTLEKRVDGTYYPLLTITDAHEYHDVEFDHSETYRRPTAVGA